MPSPFEEYRLKHEQAEKEQKAKKIYSEGMATVLDIVAPALFLVTPNDVQIGEFYVKTLFTYTYPRYLQTNWLSTLIDYDLTMDISMFVYPLETSEVMTDLKKELGQLGSSMTIKQEKGQVRDPELETAVGDIEELRDVLQRGESRLFHYSLYFTIYAKSKEELKTLTKQLESVLGGMLTYTKQSLYQMEQGFNSCLPMHNDQLGVTRNLDTGSLSTTFPFSTATLSSNEGILYGINRHNNSLILFDRFKLENANSVVFAKAGAGKSYVVKLEILRSLMLGSDVVVIDPEDEYRKLCDAVGGSYLEVSLNSEKRINPFDLPRPDDPNSKESGEDVLRSTITDLHGLISLMVGGLTPEEDSLLDKALYDTYAIKDISVDPKTQTNEAPVMSDLVSVLSNMTGTESLTKRLSKYTEGTYAGLFNQPTNFKLDEGFVVFSIRDLEEQLRPVAMYVILNYIWTQIRLNFKKRIMVVDEAWTMMQYEDSARFLFGLAKRSRKYFLGLTIISQDVEDFLGSQYGKAVVSNSSLQILLKQSTASIEKISQTFGLTEGEKMMLLESDVGEGLFFAGQEHVAIRIIASYNEDALITTNPQQIEDQDEEMEKSTAENNANSTEPPQGV
jgi:type IV secretory pathway VirB4 component